MSKKNQNINGQPETAELENKILTADTEENISGETVADVQAEAALPENETPTADAEESISEETEAETAADVPLAADTEQDSPTEASAKKKTGKGFKKKTRGKSGENDENESESKEHRRSERFRFDWELEENILEALDEDASELTEPESEPETEPIQVRGISIAQVAQAAFGLFLLVFAIIGIVATCVKISDLAKAKNDNTEQIEYFEDFLMPLVASDMPIFDGAPSLNEDVIVSAACWDIIFNPSVYYEYSNGTYSVSYQDIDRRVNKLFGAGLTYTHKTVGDTEMSFEYNEETGMYSIPAYPRYIAYYPDITNITSVEGGYELTVSYKLPITNWIETIDNVEKTMIYTVVPTDTDYNVTAIRIGEIDTTEET